MPEMPARFAFACVGAQRVTGKFRGSSKLFSSGFHGGLRFRHPVVALRRPQPRSASVNDGGNMTHLMRSSILVVAICAIAWPQTPPTTTPSTNPATNPTTAPWQITPIILCPAPEQIVSIPLTTLPTRIRFRGNTNYRFAAGTYAFSTAGIVIKGADIVIEGAPPDADGNLTTILEDTIPPGTSSYAKIFSVDAASRRVCFKNIKFKTIVADSDRGAGRTGIAVNVSGSDVTIEGCQVDTCWQWFARGARGLHIIRCKAPVLPGSWGYADHAGGAARNSNIVIENCDVAGSTTAHAIRTYGVDGLWVISSKICNPGDIERPAGVVHGQALKLCDGSNNVVLNSVLDGPCQFGPNAIAGDEACKVDGLIVRDSTFNDYIMLMSGVCGIDWRGGSVRSRGSGACFSVRPSFAGKPVASGIIANVQASYRDATRGQFFSGDWYGGIKARGTGNVFNGQPVN
jgi:hypothetical protein